MIRVKTGNRREGIFFPFALKHVSQWKLPKNKEGGGKRKYAFCLQHLLSITTKPSENEQITRKKNRLILTAARPCPPGSSVLRHCLCGQRRRERRWGAGDAGGCSAASLLLMLRESCAAPPETNWMSGGRFPTSRQPNPLNPNSLFLSELLTPSRWSCH